MNAPATSPRPWWHWYARITAWAMVALVALVAVSVLIPGGCPIREPGKRILCASHLRTIGLALREYADRHCGYYPMTFGALVDSSIEDNPALFVCLSTTDLSIEQPAAGQPLSKEEQLQAAARQIDDLDGHHCSYVYAGAGLTARDIGEDDVIAYEPATNHGEGGNILFGDGHSEWRSAIQGTPDEKVFEHLAADRAAGVRPLRLRP